MKPKRARITLGMKIFCIASSMLILLIVVAYISCDRIGKFKDKMSDLTNYLIPITDLITQAELNVGKQRIHYERLRRLHEIKLFSREEIDTERQQFVARGGKVDDSLKRAIHLSQKAKENSLEKNNIQKFEKLEPLLESIETRYQSYHVHVMKVIDLLHSNTNQEALLLEERLNVEREKFNENIKAIREVFQLMNNEAVEETKERHQRVLHVNFTITGIAIFVGLLFASLITIGVVKPVRQLINEMREVGQGNLDVEVKAISADEIGVLADSFGHMVDELKLKERIKDTFGKYVDPRVVENLVNREHNLDTGGQKQVMSVMFTDIEGFDTISEKLTPDKFIQLTNQYLNIVSKPVSHHKGVIDKFIDTTVMSFWGPPFTGASTHAKMACHAALGQIAKEGEILRLIKSYTGDEISLPKPDLRIGISTGALIVGNMGSEQSKSYTILGDTVNIASRLSGASQQYGTQTLMTEDSKKMVEDLFETREIDLIQVVGKQEQVRVFELLGVKGEVEQSLVTFKETFEKGLREYRNQIWEKAIKHFKTCLKMKPNDGPAAVFIKRIQEFRLHPPEKDWSGVWRLTRK